MAHLNTVVLSLSWILMLLKSI